MIKSANENMMTRPSLHLIRLMLVDLEKDGNAKFDILTLWCTLCL